MHAMGSKGSPPEKQIMSMSIRVREKYELPLPVMHTMVTFIVRILVAASAAITIACGG